MQEKALIEMVEVTLRRLKISGTLRGYRYLTVAIAETVYDPDRVLSITKDLYPELARKFRTAPACIERNMRHAIGKAWENGGKEALEELTRLPFPDRPSNGTYIDAVAFALRGKQRKGGATDD